MRGLAVVYMLVSLEVFGDCDKSDFRSGKREFGAYWFVKQFIINECRFQGCTSNRAGTYLVKLPYSGKIVIFEKRACLFDVHPDSVFFEIQVVSGQDFI